MKGILGRKLGMTQVFTAEGLLIPVTVIECEPNVVMQKKVVETDGYNAVQLGLEDVKAKLFLKTGMLTPLEDKDTQAELDKIKKAARKPRCFFYINGGSQELCGCSKGRADTATCTLTGPPDFPLDLLYE